MITRKTIELIEPHEHAGRSYPAGSELEIDSDAADWLVALKKARPAAKSTPRAAVSLQSESKPETSKESAA